MNGWRKQAKTGFSFYFDTIKDKEIVDKLQSVINRTEYIRQLIQADLDSTRQ